MREAGEMAERQAKSMPAPRVAGVEITHPDRLLFDGSDVTKHDLAEFYAALAPAILPFAADRPISLVRCPQGRDHPCFFQKHDAGALGDHVHHVDIREKDGSIDPYLYISDAEGLIQCVQMGTIEFHGWGSRAADVERPDRMVFDLDPDEGLGFGEVKRAAADLRERLADAGLVSFAMLTGGKGVHVVVPLTVGAPWPVIRDFAEGFAHGLAEAEPDRFTATMSKAERKGRIFIDWLRNQRGSTAVMPYTVRARSGAPVAVPVTWEELGGIASAAHWHVGDRDALRDRAASRALSGWGKAEQSVPGSST